MTISTPIILIFLFFYFLILPFCVTIFLKNKKAKKIFNIVYAVVFCLILFVGVFFKIDISKQTTTISLALNGAFFSKTFNFKFWKVDFQDFVINILMLFPLGYCFNQLFKSKQKWLYAFLLGLLVGLFIEICQFIFPVPRSPQLSDILLNGTSVLLGSVFFMLIDFVKTKINNRKVSNQQNNKK
ncbi:MAG: VanZ family protein [Christensenellales bacterium]